MGVIGDPDWFHGALTMPYVHRALPYANMRLPFQSVYIFSKKPNRFIQP